MSRKYLPSIESLSDDQDDFILDLCKRQSFLNPSPTKNHKELETANSTPEKSELLGIQDLENIME
jgi:hypothetical protein